MIGSRIGTPKNIGLLDARYVNITGDTMTGSLIFNNNVALQWKDSTGTAQDAIKWNATDDLLITNGNNDIVISSFALGNITIGSNMTLNQKDLSIYNATVNTAVIINSTGDARFAGYLRVGNSTSAPTNTTAGDITGVRLKVGDGAFGTGVEASVTGDAAISGFLRVGSETAPTNTTAGDLTATRISIGNSGAFSAGNGWLQSIKGTLTDTASGSAVANFYQPFYTPTANSSATFIGLTFDAVWNPATTITQTAVRGISAQTRIRGDGLVGTAHGGFFSATSIDSNSAATTQVTNATAVAGNVTGRPSGTSTITVGTGVVFDATAVTSASMTTATTLIGYRAQNPQAGTYTTLLGMDIASHTQAATTNIGLRIAHPALATGITASTDNIALAIPASSVTIGDQTATLTNKHGISIGIATMTSTTNTRTITNSSSLYIAGAPVASTNVTITNGPYAIWVDTGTVRFDGSLQAAAGTSTTLAKVGGTIFDHYASVTNSSTTETDLYSDSIPANTLASNGDKLLVKYSGTTANNANTKTLTLYFGGTSIASFTAPPSEADTWQFIAMIIRDSSTSIRAVIQELVGVNVNMTYSTVSALTLSNANILKVTGTGGASNDITATVGTVIYQPAA